MNKLKLPYKGARKRSKNTLTYEEQRVGRNKETQINLSYINSSEYRRKFDTITANPEVNRIVYQKAKEMLLHRRGTLFEDMYWLDGKSGEVVASAIDEVHSQAIRRNRKRDKRIKENKNIIVMHTHPLSMPPSPADFYSMWEMGYKKALIICHNGTIYEYGVAEKEPNIALHTMYIDRALKDGYTEIESQMLAIKKSQNSTGIYCKEVI